MSKRFSTGMFSAIGLVLLIFTAGWVAGFVELVRHIENLRPDVINAAGITLGISYAITFIFWWVWFCYMFAHIGYSGHDFFKPSVYAFTALVLALFTGGWFGGFLSLTHHTELMTHGSAVGGGWALGFLGASILIWWIGWLFAGAYKLFEE